MIETQKHIRKPLYVDAVRVTNANFEEIAKWCQGEVIVPGIDDDGFRGDKKHIKVRVHNPKNPRQTKAFVGDWLLYTERGYKVYTNKAFHASFDPVAGAIADTPPPPGQVFTTSSTEVTRPIEEPNEDMGGTPVVSHEYEPVSEMAQAVKTIEDEGGTVEPATSEAIADVVAQNEQARLTEGKTVLSLEDQANMDQDEIRELLRSGEYILAQDLAA